MMPYAVWKRHVAAEGILSMGLTHQARRVCLDGGTHQRYLQVEAQAACMN